jgi:hypothetical protein
MKLMTKEIERNARSQHERYAASSLSELQIVPKFFDPCGSGPERRGLPVRHSQGV